MAAWYGIEGWDHRLMLTLDNTKVGADADNVPCHVKITDTECATLFAEAQANGDDMLFTNSDGTTKLDHELDYYVTDGTKVSWAIVEKTVDVDALDYAYLYFGNPGAGNQENVNGTYESNIVMAHHMTGAQATALDDSTSYANDVLGDSSGTESYDQAGKLYHAVDLVAATDRLDLANTDLSGDFHGALGLSLHAWLNPSTITGEDVLLSCKIGNGRDGVYIYLDGGNNDGLRAGGRSEYDDGFQLGDEGDVVAEGSWQFVWVDFNIDGDSITTYVGSAAGDTTGGLTWGSNTYADQGDGDSCQIGPSYDGLIDELWAHKTDRGSNYRTTIYNNQNKPLIGEAGGFWSAYDLQYQRFGAALIAATGTLGINGVAVNIGQAAIAAQPVLICIGRLAVQLGVAVLTATGLLEVNGVSVVVGESALTTQPVLTANGVVIAIGKAAIAATGILSALGMRVRTESAAMVATGVLAVDGVAVDIGQADMAATSVLSIDESIVLIGVADMAATGVLSLVGQTVSAGYAALQAEGTLTPNGIIVAIGQAAMAARPKIWVSGHEISEAYGSLTAGSTLSASGVIIAIGQSGIAAQPVLTVDGVVIAIGAAALAATPLLTAVPTRVRYGKVLITAGGTLTCVGLAFVAKQLIYSGTISPGEVLVIDTDAMTVKLDGVTVRVNFDGEFFKLFVGDNEVEYLDNEAARTALVGIDHQDRWM